MNLEVIGGKKLCTYLILPPIRNSQAVAAVVQTIATTSQQVNQNVMDVVEADLAATLAAAQVQPTQGTKRGRRRPPKNTQPPSTQPVTLGQPSTATQPSSSQPSSSTASGQTRYNLRNR